MTKTTRILTIASTAAIALLGLSGCALSAPAQPIPAIDPAAPFDDVFLESLDGTRVSFDDWKADWDAAGCTPALAATDVDCSTALIGGGMLVDSVHMMLQALAPDGQPLGELASTFEASTAAYESSVAWSDAQCAAELTAECAPLAEQAAADVLAVQAELTTWSR